MRKSPIDSLRSVLLLGMLAGGCVLLVVALSQLTRSFAVDPEENPTLVFKVQQGNSTIGSTNTSGGAGGTLYYAVNDTITLDAYVDCSGGASNWTVEIDNDGTGSSAGSGPGQFLTNTTLNATGSWTVESHADQGNSTLGPISGTIWVMDVAAAKAQNVSGGFEAGTVYRGLPTNGTLSVPIQSYLTDGTNTTIADEAQRPYTFGWNLTRPGGSSATLADQTNLGTNVTGIDVVGNYDLEAKAGPSGSVGNVTLKIIEIQSVTANKTTILAGAKDTSLHQTSINVTINPALQSVPVNLSLIGGNGYEGNTTRFGQYVAWDGPAKLEAGNQTYVAGETENPIQVPTDAQGKVIATLTSSNRFDENTTVKAQYGSASKTVTVEFDEPYVGVNITGPVAVGYNQQVAVTVRFPGSTGDPVEGHDIFVYVRNVQVNGSWQIAPNLELVVDPCWRAAPDAAKSKMDMYATITTGARQNTPADGNITANVTLIDLGPGVSIDEVNVGAADASIHDGTPD